MIDTHCHFDFTPFCDDAAHYLHASQQQGVKQIIIPAVARDNWAKLLHLCETFSGLSFAIGLHPMWLDAHQDNDINELERLIGILITKQNHHFVAIGECGLDFSTRALCPEKQEALLYGQLSLAVKYQRPVILHCRNAHNALLKILNKFPKLHGVLHGFTGSEALAWEYIRRGFLLGIGGSISYLRANKTRKTVAALPLQYLVLETDAPDMPICGLQGQANLPQYLPLIVKVLAQLKGVSSNAVIKQTTLNAKRCFNIE